MRKALVTAAHGPDHKTLLAHTQPSHEEFSEINGYDYIVDKTPAPHGFPPQWGKVDSILRLLDSYDLVFWIDCDAKFMRYVLFNEWLLSQTDCFQIIGLERPHAINTGVWIMRGHDYRATDFLQKCLAFREREQATYDQGAVRSLLRQDAMASLGTVLMPPRFNCVFGDQTRPVIRHAAGITGRRTIEARLAYLNG